MPEGGIVKVYAVNYHVTKKEVSSLKAGKYIKVTIEDQGVGIPKERNQKIFDPYFTTKEKGCGLGLAISYSIIKNHGGCIDVESELGSGTTFYFYLPASNKEIKIKEEKVKTPFGGKGRVLIMDDDDLLRSATGERLTRLDMMLSLPEKLVK